MYAYACKAGVGDAVLGRPVYRAVELEKVHAIVGVGSTVGWTSLRCHAGQPLRDSNALLVWESLGTDRGSPLRDESSITQREVLAQAFVIGSSRNLYASWELVPSALTTCTAIACTSTTASFKGRMK